MQFLASLATALLATASLVSASPVHVERAKLDVWAPPVLSPTTGDSFVVGQKTNVTWDISNPPSQITNKIGRVVLGKDSLITGEVLADGFNITDGTVEVTVPEVTPDDDYFVVLFGDSGNWSGVFAIEADGEVTADV